MEYCVEKNSLQFYGIKFIGMKTEARSLFGVCASSFINFDLNRKKKIDGQKTPVLFTGFFFLFF